MSEDPQADNPFADPPCDDPVYLNEETLRRRGIPPPIPPKPEHAVQPEKPLATVPGWVLILPGVMALGVLYTLTVMMLVGAPSTFPTSMHTYPEDQLVLARQVSGRLISSGEISSGSVQGVGLVDMERSMAADLEYNKNIVVVPMNYGPRFPFSVVGFYTDRPIVLLNPYIASSSGLVTVDQKPLFCSVQRGYKLPSHIVVGGSLVNTTTISRFTLEGSQAAMVYTLIMQMDGQDVCGDWKKE